jgi:hypothetical protein
MLNKRKGEMYFMNWKETLLTRISNLLSVKTIITVILSVIFAILAMRGAIEAKDVLTVYLVIVGFYFGTQ